MPKAVLVIDMPRDCIDCPCYHVLDNKPICEVNGLTSLYSTNYDEERPSFCPLRPLPEKCDIEKLAYPERDADFMMGWNACITELLELMENENE